MTKLVDVYAVAGFGDTYQNKIVKHALPQKRTIRLLCELINERHPGISGAELARICTTMGFNHATAATTAQEWRKARGYK